MRSLPNLSIGQVVLEALALEYSYLKDLRSWSSGTATPSTAFDTTAPSLRNPTIRHQMCRWRMPNSFVANAPFHKDHFAHR